MMYKPDATHQRQPSTMSPHNFKHECARVRDSGGMDVVDSLADSVHGSWGADSQIGHGHIIIY
jgi:hypothetical protein